MKSEKVSIVGKVSDSGELLIGNRQEMLEFFKSHRNEKVIMVATVYPQKGSDALRGYYFKKVVPDFQFIFREKDGERLSLKETDEKLRKMSPIMLEEIPEEEAGGFDLVRVCNAYEVSFRALYEHIEFVRMIAAREYGIEITDPER